MNGCFRAFTTCFIDGTFIIRIYSILMIAATFATDWVTAVTTKQFTYQYILFSCNPARTSFCL